MKRFADLLSVAGKALYWMAFGALLCLGLFLAFWANVWFIQWAAGL